MDFRPSQESSRTDVTRRVNVTPLPLHAQLGFPSSPSIFAAFSTTNPTIDYSVPFAKGCDELLRTHAAGTFAPFPEQIAAFYTLFTDTAVPAAKVARDAAAPIIRDPTHNECFDRLWALLFDTISQLPEHKDKFVQPIPPMSPPNVVDFARKRQAIVNHHAFVAKLAALDIADQIHRGDDLMCTILESAPWERYHRDFVEDAYESDNSGYSAWRDEYLEQFSVRTLNGIIPAVVEWIKYAGTDMYNMKGELMGERPVYRNPKWDGPKGWSKDRFAFWRYHLKWAVTVTALSMKTKRLAKWAAECMKHIERGESLDAVTEAADQMQCADAAKPRVNDGGRQARNRMRSTQT
ncbi:hypothetical protein K458DRAFT_491678 [Lentithecium fluviatile CBS 122367]|uniref:Uncharacterized protein n=1 Tax=Lentithecium fluviatile CBS 122367 TaxID=1168545 RepID=A0A6G1IIC9_9PLEO|nr:hypothetical protein K458DRAFT_491678 [Lentithecium fluviatile CBS 122367]